MKRRWIFFTALLIILSFIAGVNYEIYIDTSDLVSHDNESYDNKRNSYFDTDENNIEKFHCFSNGIIIKNVDVYNMSCNLIDAAYEKNNEIIKRLPLSVDDDIFKLIDPASAFGTYNDSCSEFSYSITEIDYFEDKIVVEFIWLYEIKDNATGKVLAGGETNYFPDRIYMKYDNGKWNIIDFQRML